MNNNITQVNIIGAGPSGIAAAIQLAHFGISFKIFEENILGGLLNSAGRVDNYPGISTPKPGKELIKDFAAHLNRKNIEITYSKINKVEYKNNCFKLTSKTSKYQSDYLILATGTLPKSLVGIEDKIKKETITYNINDILEMKNSSIAIIGSGDATFDAALSLCKKNNIHIINKNKKEKAFLELVRKVENKTNINYYRESEILNSKQIGNRTRINCFNKNKEFELTIDKLLITIGRQANDTLYKMITPSQLLIESNKLFIIGDLNGSIYRQTAIAIGEGIKASMKIYKSIESKNIN